MLKNNKLRLIASSVIIMLPAIVALLFWDKLPNEVTTHWGINGTPDASSEKISTIILPLILLITHWICIVITAYDPKNKDQNSKVFGLVLWIMPFVSLFSSAIIYFLSAGYDFAVDNVTFCFIGLLFIVIGNYIPKCRQNHTIGVRIKWTLKNEDNWNATHRFTSKLWVVGGFIFLFTIFLSEKLIAPVMLLFVISMTIPPIIYSYAFSRKHHDDNNADIPTSSPVTSRKYKITVTVVVIVILIISALLMFIGDIVTEFEESSFTIEASLWEDAQISYESVESVEYRESFNRGTRMYGVGSARLMAGRFKNDEFESYTLYSYTACNAVVILKSHKGEVIAIGAQNKEETLKIYNELKSRTEN